MHRDFSGWLEAQGYQLNTRQSKTSQVASVERKYGALDECLQTGGFDTLIAELTYSTADERSGRPNPSKIVINGNIRNCLASYKDAAKCYERFWTERGGERATDTGEGDATIFAVNEETALDAQQDGKQRLALERDMQAALRAEIAKLETGLTIVDDGAERSVQSGFIDILCRDEAGQLVVVELKAGKTGPSVMGQVLGYMGDLIEDNPDETVRGIVVAHEFDKRTFSAARAVPSVQLVTYSIQFEFQRVQEHVS